MRTHTLIARTRAREKKIMNNSVKQTVFRKFISVQWDRNFPEKKSLTANHKSEARVRTKDSETERKIETVSMANISAKPEIGFWSERKYLIKSVHMEPKKLGSISIELCLLYVCGLVVRSATINTPNARCAVLCVPVSHTHSCPLCRACLFSKIEPSVCVWAMTYYPFECAKRLWACRIVIGCSAIDT